MFIKQINKKFKGNDKVYHQHRLVESYRTEAGPRHSTILNLGTLTLPKEKWKLLADRIELLILGRDSFFQLDSEIELLAVHYAELITKKKLLLKNNEIAKSKDEVATQQRCCVEENKDKTTRNILPEFEEIDLNSLTNSQNRTIGAEHVGVEMFKKLGLDNKLAELGFTQKEVSYAALSIVGRLVAPQSEKATRSWARSISGIDELLGEDFSNLSNNALYRISDKLLDVKSELETYLAAKEKDLFSLEEKIILYDLTNTHFEGQAKGIKRAKFGRSKQKRRDCRLLTLALVIDERGFPKKSDIYEGNVPECSTLLEMIEKLGSTDSTGKKKTIVMDAGIATEDNIKALRDKGYDYICVARNKSATDEETQGKEGLVTVKEDKRNKVEIKLIKREDESILYCKSFLRGEKERSMLNLLRRKLEEELTNQQLSLAKKGTTKSYSKIVERIGRIKQRNSKVAQYYSIEVKKEVKEEGKEIKGKEIKEKEIKEEKKVKVKELKANEKEIKAESIEWKFTGENHALVDFDGSYFIRTSRTDLDESTVWSIYTMLTRVEDSFRCLKSELNLRPVWHRKQERADSHLFITVLAYHLLNSIQNILDEKNIHTRWENIRKQLSTQGRVTTSVMNKEGQKILIRNTMEPESYNLSIYKALGIKSKPLQNIKTW